MLIFKEDREMGFQSADMEQLRTLDMVLIGAIYSQRGQGKVLIMEESTTQ